MRQFSILSNRTLAPTPQTAVKGLCVCHDHDTVRTSPLLLIVHISQQDVSNQDRCHDRLAWQYKHVDGLSRVYRAPLAPRPWFEDGVLLELPARLVCIAVCTSFLSGAQAQVAVLKEREGEFTEPVLVSADLYHIVPDRPCAPLEGPFLHDNLLLDASPLLPNLCCTWRSREALRSAR